MRENREKQPAFREGKTFNCLNAEQANREIELWSKEFSGRGKEVIKYTFNPESGLIIQILASRFPTDKKLRKDVFITKAREIAYQQQFIDSLVEKCLLRVDKRDIEAREKVKKTILVKMKKMGISGMVLAATVAGIFIGSNKNKNEEYGAQKSAISFSMEAKTEPEESTGDRLLRTDEDEKASSDLEVKKEEIETFGERMQSLTAEIKNEIGPMQANSWEGMKLYIGKFQKKMVEKGAIDELPASEEKVVGRDYFLTDGVQPVNYIYEYFGEGGIIDGEQNEAKKAVSNGIEEKNEEKVIKGSDDLAKIIVAIVYQESNGDFQAINFRGPDRSWGPVQFNAISGQGNNRDGRPNFEEGNLRLLGELIAKEKGVQQNEVSPEEIAYFASSYEGSMRIIQKLQAEWSQRENTLGAFSSTKNADIKYLIALHIQGASEDAVKKWTNLEAYKSVLREKLQGETLDSLKEKYGEWLGEYAERMSVVLE